MKNIIITGAIALSASISFANQEVNIRKVNRVIKSVVQTEVTPTINKIEIKFDKRSNLETLEKLKVGASLSATAKESVWSKKPTTVDVKGELKTVHTDPAHTKAQIIASLGSKTDAISLYNYIATLALKDFENIEDPSTDDLNLIALFEEATLTTKLEQIPDQLKKFIIIIKNKIADTPEDNDEMWAKLMNSLKVDTKVQNHKTTEVTLKTTVAVLVNFFDINHVISDLALKITDGNLSFEIKVAATIETLNATEMFQQTKESLIKLQNSDEETLARLKDMTSGYVHMAETIVKGESK